MSDQRSDTDPIPAPAETAPTGGEALDDVHESELTDTGAGDDALAGDSAGDGPADSEALDDEDDDDVVELGDETGVALTTGVDDIDTGSSGGHAAGSGPAT